MAAQKGGSKMGRVTERWHQSPTQNDVALSRLEYANETSQVQMQIQIQVQVQIQM